MQAQVVRSRGNPQQTTGRVEHLCRVSAANAIEHQVLWHVHG